jgi:hypothetical protein
MRESLWEIFPFSKIIMLEKYLTGFPLLRKSDSTIFSTCSLLNVTFDEPVEIKVNKQKLARIKAIFIVARYKGLNKGS